jgi:hypothetical protein
MEFSVWSKFDNREHLPNIDLPGIYALAVNDQNMAGTAFEYCREIIYFGMTNARTGLRGRLNAFDNSLRDKKGGGHGGAQRVRFDYENGDELARKLYVAICVFECDVTSMERFDLETMGEVARAEYLAFAEYVERYGSLPKYNDKKRSPKRKPLLSA